MPGTAFRMHHLRQRRFPYKPTKGASYDRKQKQPDTEHPAKEIRGTDHHRRFHVLQDHDHTPTALQTPFGNDPKRKNQRDPIFRIAENDRSDR